MPIVPVQPNLINTDVPGMGVSTQGAGAVQQALAGFGEKVQQTSLQLLHEAKKAEAQDASSKAYYQDYLDSEKMVTELKLKSPDGYVYDNSGLAVTNADGTKRTISQEYRDWANDRYTRTQESMPSEMAQRLYQERSGAFYTKTIGSMKADEQLLMVNSFNSSLNENTQKLTDNLVSMPEVNKAYDHSNSISLDIRNQSGRLYSTPVADEKVLKANQQISEGLFKGAYNQVLMGAKTQGKAFDAVNEVTRWRLVLAGEDAISQQRKQQGLPTLSDMLTPDNKAQMDEAFIRLLKQTKEFSKSDLNDRVRETNAALRMNVANPNAVMKIASDLAEGVKLGAVTEVEMAQTMGILRMNDRIGKTMSGPEFYLSPPSERQAIVEQGGKASFEQSQALLGKEFDKDIGRHAQEQFINEGNKQVQESISQEQSDYAAYIEGHDVRVKTNLSQIDFSNPAAIAKYRPQIQDTMKRLDRYYDTHFPGQPQYKRVIDKERSALISKTLMDPNYNTQNTAMAIRSLSTAYGSKYPELIDQMIKDGHLHEGWRFAGMMNDYLPTEDVVVALKGRNEVFDKNFKFYSASKGLKEDDFRRSVSEQVAPFMTALQNQKPNDKMTADQMSTMIEVVKVRAMQKFIESNGNITPDQAAKSASDAMINNQVHIKELGGGGFLGFGAKNGQKSLILIPKKLNGRAITDQEANNVRENFSTMLTPERLKTIGVTPPPQANGKPSPFGDEFFQQIVNTGKATLAPDRRGFYIWYTYQNQNSAYRDVQAFRKSKSGKIEPVYIPLDTLLSTPKGRKPNSTPPVFMGGSQ